MLQSMGLERESNPTKGLNSKKLGRIGPPGSVCQPMVRLRPGGPSSWDLLGALKSTDQREMNCVEV